MLARIEALESAVSVLLAEAKSASNAPRQLRNLADQISGIAGPGNFEVTRLISLAAEQRHEAELLANEPLKAWLKPTAAA